MAYPAKIISLVHNSVNSLYSLATSIKAVLDSVYSVSHLVAAATHAAEKLEQLVVQFESSSLISKLDPEVFENLLADIDQVKIDLTEAQCDVSATSGFTFAFRSRH